MPLVFASFESGSNLVGKPLALDTILRSSVPPHCGQSWARASELKKTHATTRQSRERKRRRMAIRVVEVNAGGNRQGAKNAKTRSRRESAGAKSKVGRVDSY